METHTHTYTPQTLFTFFFASLLPSILQCTYPHLFCGLSQLPSAEDSLKYSGVSLGSSLQALHMHCCWGGSVHEQESLGDVCASVFADFHLRYLEMSHPEMQDWIFTAYWYFSTPRLNVIFIGEQADWLFIANSVAGVFFSPPVKPRDVYVPRIHVTVTKLARTAIQWYGYF